MAAAIPNRMIENWLLADVSHLSRTKNYVRDKLRQKNYEGTHGKTELKRLLVRGHSYVETKDGPDLFMAVRLPEARTWSPSLDHFLKQLEAEQVIC